MGSLWNRSGTIERFGADDQRAAGAKAYFYQGGTTTPLTVFEDAFENSAHPFPLEANANGRWPDVFVPYVLAGYDVRVTTSTGEQISFSQSIPNPDPTETVTTISPNDILQTGMIHGEFVNTVKSGYVRLNGRTIGNSASIATERANADTVNLFTYLWNNLANAQAPVSGGRGLSAAVDYAANKTITLPDMRGAVLIGLDDMGNSALGGYGASNPFLTGNSTTAGSYVGANQTPITVANLPASGISGTVDAGGDHNHTGLTGGQSADHTHSGTTGGQSVGHVHDGSTLAIGNTNLQHHHSYDKPDVGSVQSGGGAGVSLSTFTSTSTTDSLGDHTHGISGNTGAGSADHVHSFTTGISSGNHQHTISNSGTHTHTFTSNAMGSGTALNNIPFAHLVTWFIKL